MMLEIYSGINLYAQLSKLAENGPKQDGPPQRAGALSLPFPLRVEQKVVFLNEMLDFATKFKNQLAWHRKPRPGPFGMPVTRVLHAWNKLENQNEGCR